MSLPLLVGCSLDAEMVGDDGEAEPDAQSPVSVRGADAVLQVQSGARLLLLEVTDDNYAIYQDGSSVYATSLRAQAQRALIGEVPAGNFAFVYRVGKVAFVWTNPDRSLPGFGVSPLVIWSAASGAHLASSASPIGTLATSASRDGRYVVFPSNGSADGATGDLEFASTDLSTRATLVSAAQMRFPNGPCRPLATFVDAGSGRDPVASYCQGTATTATVSRWHDGQRRELVAAAVAPPLLSIDAERKLLLTQLAGSRYPSPSILGTTAKRTARSRWWPRWRPRLPSWGSMAPRSTPPEAAPVQSSFACDPGR